MINNQEIIRKVKESFDKISKIFNKSRRDEWYEILRLIPDNVDKIVDVGCGCGANALAISRKCRRQYVGIDISLEMLKQLKNLLNNDSRLDIVNSDIRYLPLRNSICDIATCIATLHHIPTREWRIESIRELVRISRNAVLITVWRVENVEKLRCLKLRDNDYIVYWSWSLDRKVERFYHMYSKLEIIEEIEHVKSNKLRIIIYFPYIRRGYLNDVVMIYREYSQ